MLSKTEFNKKLATIKTHDERLHNAIEQCIEFSIHQINEHQQLSPLNDLLAACGSLRTKLNKAVRRHVSVINATYDKDANKFTKNKKAKGKPMKAKAREKMHFWESIAAVAPKRNPKPDAPAPKRNPKSDAPAPKADAPAPKADAPTINGASIDKGAPRVIHAADEKEAASIIHAAVADLDAQVAAKVLRAELARLEKANKKLA